MPIEPEDTSNSLSRLLCLFILVVKAGCRELLSERVRGDVRDIRANFRNVISSRDSYGVYV